jgi:hypothetical protein
MVRASMRTLLSWASRCGLVLAVLLGASNAYAGSCFCESETYIRVLLKTATPAELSACEKEAPDMGGGQTYKVDEDEAYRCVSGVRYRYVATGELPVESFRRVMEAFLARKQAGRILNAQAYRDPGLRAKVRPLMVSTRNAPLWDALVKASDGDKAAFTQVLYFYCENYPAVVELLQYEGPLPRTTLAQFWPLPAGMTPKQATQRLKCAFGQAMLLESAIRSLDAELNPQALVLLSAKQLRLLRNAVYARHGRVFDSKELKEYFSGYQWYRADPAYTETRLTPVDKRNLEILQQAEKTAR